MTRLSERDYEAMLAIVAEAATTVSSELVPVPLLDAIRRLFSSAETLAFFEGAPWDRATRRVVRSGHYHPWDDDEKRLVDVLRSQIPLGPSPATVGRAIRVTDFMTAREYRRTDLYQLVGRRHDIRYAMDCWTRASDGMVRGLCLGSSYRDFDDRERDLLEVLARYLQPVLSRFDPTLPTAATAKVGLTERQSQVLALVANGATNREVAKRLWISEHTVRKHLENAYSVLGVHNRTGAIARVRAQLGPEPRAESTR